MNNQIFDRLELLTGGDGLEKLSKTKVLVFGAGGVGSWAAEALVRSGIGKIGVIDFDAVCASNINRQIEATTMTIGQPKTQALQKRLLEINQSCEVAAWNEIFCRENASHFDIGSADYVIDAIDSLRHKIDLIETVCTAGIKLYSSMGMARKMDPSRIKAASIWDTSACPLARLVRHELRGRGFSGNFTAVYSDELLPRAVKAAAADQEENAAGKKYVNGSVVTVTASAGMLLAGLVLRDITGI
ncbi:MAG: tRNA threonylcarbamoyladenosine dehydratase [Treponema sp.]|jgi:tRNA A37 threonylcarbamoyladenosine dehydratase|nr:tRNA threonylcarbamoyladenosine dehydratase [Treponema sp.]